MPAVQPAPSAPGAVMQRRHSSASSDGTGSDHGLSGSSRHTSQENIALIPTRTSKIATTKPAANPLQFVKVGPCDLSRFAQEQVKKAEEVKKVKPEKRDEAEDWQSNLDNWKFSRRKRQEHIIERVVEVKKLELEEHDRNRRRSKTFSEMLEDRNMKGRKTSLPIYQDDDNDLSELGLSIPKANGDDSVFHDGKDSASSTDDISRTSFDANGENGTVTGPSRRDKREISSEQEEYTYERAIQNYVNFTESRVRGQSLTPSDSDSSKLTNGFCKKSSPPIPSKPRRGSCKIEEKLCELEQVKKKSMSTNDLTENTKKPLSVPKVDILKRREMFEKPLEEEAQSAKNRLSGDFGSSKSISERLSSLGKPSESTQSIKKANRISSEISVKQRLSNIEKQKSLDSTPPKSNKLPNDNAAISTASIQKSTSFKKSSSTEKTQPKTQVQKTLGKIELKEEPLTTSPSIQENLTNNKSASSKKINSAESNLLSSTKTITNGPVNGEHKEAEKLTDNYVPIEPSLGSPTDEMYETKRQHHYRHRSLDSLDVESNDGVGNESFERVQSLEDLDYCGNYPASSVSGDTDREDSGIHTADVSSSVSQADDCDLHLEGEFHQPPTILEEIRKNRDHTGTTLIPKPVNQISKCERSLVENSHHLSALMVDVGNKPVSTNSTLLPIDTTTCLPLFPLSDNKLMDSIEAVFPLSPSTMEPPKEKPPPPPTDVSDEEDATNANNKPVSLRRLDSTKRIKKEIRQKRSSFLGIDGPDDDNYLEPELELVRRPPDISSFLAEEKRLEQLLYRQSICSESESRDSGVELEKHHDDLAWGHHSRDNSETYANASTTSEEEEIVKKEREIIELLEREEINRYSSNSQEKENIGEKLAERLRELEAEKSRLEWEREAEQAARAEQQSRIQARERELCKKENTEEVEEMDIDTELLLAERERLEAEQASLARQRDIMLQQQYNRSLTDVRLAEAGYSEYRRSMQDLRTPEPVQRRPVEPPPTDNRRSMPDLTVQPRRPPPPIPPAKPLIIPRSPEKRLSSPQQMTRQTLQALSAAPKSRLSDNWLQPRRKPNNSNNYQHWLVQEAEQRRITEHHQRQAPPPRRPVPPPPQQNRAWTGNESNGQYTNWHPVGGQWGATPHQQRSDKPLPDAIIQTLTQRVQNRFHTADPNNNRRRIEPSPPQIDSRQHLLAPETPEKMLSVSGKKKCSHCGDELGRGAAMIIESLRLFYHIDCFKCCVCCVQLGDGLMGTDVRVRNNKLHCHNCYSSDDGVKFSCV